VKLARVAAALVCAAGIVASGGALAIAAPAPAPTGASVTLTSQAAWTPLGGSLALGLRVDGATPGLSLSVVAHQAVTSRSAFDRTSRGQSLGSVLDQVVLPLDLFPADSSGARPVAIGLEAPGGARDPLKLGIRRRGVYPLAVELRDSEDHTLSRFVTYLVAVDSTLGSATSLDQPLGVAWVWPLVAGPAARPDGEVDPAVVASFRADGRLGRQVAALTRSPDVPVTVVPGPETLQTWASAANGDPAIANGVSALRSASTVDQVVSGPYVPIDLPSLLAGGLFAAVDAQFVQGDETLKRFFDTRLDPRTALARPVDTNALSRLRAGGVDRVIVESSALSAGSSQEAPTRPFTLDASSALGVGSVSAVASDAGFEALLTGTEPAALRAQRLLAGLSVAAIEQPESPRAVVVMNPDSFAPSSALLDAVTRGLRQNPWLRPMTVDAVFSQIQPETASNDTAVTRTLEASTPTRPIVSAARYDAAAQRLNAFRGLATSGDPTVAVAERALLSSVSSSWTVPGQARRATQEIGVVDGTIDSFLAEIHVPAPSTITLTSRSGEVPLTFENETGHTVSVLVQLDSQKLFFPDGESRLVDLPPKSTTVRFAVEARTSGTFPLRMHVLSADGALAITETSFRVRSTAVSSVGLVLMVGAGAFLALWWGLDFRRRRRKAAVVGSTA
jgi:hypothetical protein